MRLPTQIVKIKPGSLARIAPNRITLLQAAGLRLGDLIRAVEVHTEAMEAAEPRKIIVRRDGTAIRTVRKPDHDIRLRGADGIAKMAGLYAPAPKEEAGEKPAIHVEITINHGGHVADSGAKTLDISQG